MRSADNQRLDSQVQFVKGVGPRYAKLLAKLNIYTIRDLLFHFPRRYEDRRSFASVGQLRGGERVTVKGRVADVELVPTRSRMTILKVYIDDGTGSLSLTFFNQPWNKEKFVKLRGKEIIAYGEVKLGRFCPEMLSPEWELCGSGEDSFAAIVPIYPATEGLMETRLRKLIRDAVESCSGMIEEYLPDSVRKHRKLMGLREAVIEMHIPTSQKKLKEARTRLAFDELFVLQTALVRRKMENASPGKGRAFKVPEDFDKDLKELFPFEPTNAQKRVIGEIVGDMTRPECMNRLIQGDVGSGKTAVAAAAMLLAVRNGAQAVLMAPTEILAEQHYLGLTAMFERVDFMNIRTELLIGSLTEKRKREAYERIASGEADIIIGTHAVIQKNVNFKDPGLVIVDEQHRFGVAQRGELTRKGAAPDVIVMTATPIPRTLVLAVYGDLDISVIDELPPGRKPIRTHRKSKREAPKVYDIIRGFLEKGLQAYVVCPLIEESEKTDVRAAVELYEYLSDIVFSDYRVALLHGRMKTDEKDAVMKDFRDGKISVLVSTTVIEVGVDVPNANIMVIEDADRFGLAQLHQLRGRVGRGAEQSYCILITDAETEDAQKRADVMCATCDGFLIAEEDLKLRGPGEVLGMRQSGLTDFKVADIFTDTDILSAAKEEASRLLREDPKLIKKEHAGLKAAVAAMYNPDEAVGN